MSIFPSSELKEDKKQTIGICFQLKCLDLLLPPVLLSNIFGTCQWCVGLLPWQRNFCECLLGKFCPHSCKEKWIKSLRHTYMHFKCSCAQTIACYLQLFQISFYTHFSLRFLQLSDFARVEYCGISTSLQQDRERCCM